MTMKPDQERVRGLLTDTVTLLCKNGLQYSKELKVQGLLGITLDNDDVFVVHINEIFDGLVGGQVAGITSGETATSAIAAADSATQPNEREVPIKSRKSVPHRHGMPRTSSPMLHGHGSNKRKSSLKSLSPMVKVKKEEDDDDDIVVMDSKSEQDNSSDFIPGNSELSGDGDREAMRMSYGGVELREEPSSKRRLGDSNASHSESNMTGVPYSSDVRNIKENSSESTDIIIGSESLEGSQLSGIDPTQDNQVIFENTPGCSGWSTSQSQDPDGQNTAQEMGSQESMPAGKISSTQLVKEVIHEGLPPGTELVVVKGEGTRSDQYFLHSDEHGNESVLGEQAQESKAEARRGAPPVEQARRKYASRQSRDTGASLSVHNAPRFKSSLQRASKPSRRGKYTNDLKPFVCWFQGCSNRYFHKRDLQRHVRTSHKESVQEAPDTPLIYTCGYPKCTERYTGLVQAMAHIKEKHPRDQKESAGQVNKLPPEDSTVQ